MYEGRMRIIQGVSETYGQILGMNFAYQDMNICSYKHGSANVLFPSHSPLNLVTMNEVSLMENILSISCKWIISVL
jgi:hypothetical protein